MVSSLKLSKEVTKVYVAIVVGRKQRSYEPLEVK
jgi:hypothetical protein